jgi:hypothetical protein
MTQDEIIEMVRKAGFSIADGIVTGGVTDVKRFAKLVEDKVTARYMQLFLDPENQPTQFGTATQEYRAQEIKDEREACAKVADEYAKGLERNYSEIIADEIRARGNYA